MYQSQLQYLPLTPPFFLILVGLFVLLLILLQLGALNYAFMRLGLSPGAALVLLFACLAGSYFNSRRDRPHRLSGPALRWL